MGLDLLEVILFSKYLWQTSTSNTAKKFSDTFCSEILKRINDFNKNKKTKNTRAKFICALTIKWPEGKKISEIGAIEGNITSKKGKNGFGYDPIFITLGYKKTFGEMDYIQKISMDHRFVAFTKLEKKIKDYF